MPCRWPPGDAGHREPGHRSFRPRRAIHVVALRRPPSPRRPTGLDGQRRRLLPQQVAEAFFSGLQRELRDQHHWATREQLALAIFGWIETWYYPRGLHSYNNGLSPTDYETAN